MDEDEKCFVLNADKQSMEKAPGFDKDDWPDMSDPDWGSEIANYYRITPD